MIDSNKKRFLTINSFDDKKSKKRNKFFFKKHLKTYSQTLFSIFLSVLEKKNKTKNQWQLCFLAVEKKTQKKSTFFSMIEIFVVFFLTVEVIFLIVKILIDFFLSTVKIFDVFFDC